MNLIPLSLMLSLTLLLLLHFQRYFHFLQVSVEMPFYTSVSEKAVRGRFLARFKTYMPVSGNATVTLYKKSPVSLPDSSFTEVTRKDVHIVSKTSFTAKSYFAEVTRKDVHMVSECCLYCLPVWSLVTMKGVHIVSNVFTV